MKPERIEELLQENRTLAASGVRMTHQPIPLDEAQHLLRCARAVAELDRAWNYRIQRIRDGVMISFQDLPLNSREESEGPDLLTATEAALARAKENPDAT